MTGHEPPALAAQSAGGRVARNSVLQAGADALGKIGMLVLYAVIAREAGVDAFGDFTTATSLSILVMIAAFGMDYRITRLVAREEDGVAAAFWGAILLKLVLGVILLAAVTGVAAAGPYADRVVLATALLGVATLVELTMLTPHAVFRGLERLQAVAVAITITRLGLSAVGIAVILAGGTIVGVAGGWLVSALVGLAYSVWRLRAAGLAFPVHVTRASLRDVGLDSLGLGLAGVLGAALARLDIVLIGLLKDSEAVALYGGAYRLVESSQFLTTAFALSSFPALARLTRTTVPTLGEATVVTMKVVLVVTVPIAVCFVLYATPLLEAVYGGDFGDGGTTLRVLALTAITSGMQSLVAFILTAQQRQRPLIVAMGVATLVNIGANLVLIPAHGAEGAAAAWALTTVVLTTMLLIAVARAGGRLPGLRIVTGPASAGLAMAGCGTLLGSGAISVLPAAAAFAVVLLVVERRLYPQDADRIARALRRRPVVG